MMHLSPFHAHVGQPVTAGLIRHIANGRKFKVYKHKLEKYARGNDVWFCTPDGDIYQTAVQVGGQLRCYVPKRVTLDGGQRHVGTRVSEWYIDMRTHCLCTLVTKSMLENEIFVFQPNEYTIELEPENEPWNSDVYYLRNFERVWSEPSEPSEPSEAPRPSAPRPRSLSPKQFQSLFQQTLSTDGKLLQRKHINQQQASTLKSLISTL